MLSKIKALLLGDSAASRQVSKNTAWLVLAEGLSSGIKFFLAIYAASLLGATEFGTFSFALGFVSLFGIFLDAGLNQIVVREFAKGREQEKFFPALFTLQIVLGLLTVTLVSLLSFAATSDPRVRWMIMILGVYLALGGFLNLLLSVFRARQDMKREVYPRVFVAAVTTALCLAALHYNASAMTMSFGYLAGALLAFVNCLFFFQSRAFRLRISIDVATWKSFLRDSFTLALLSGLSSVIYNNLDSSLLGFFGNLTENGWYSAAYKILLLSLMPLVFISQAFFPALSVARQESSGQLQKLWNREVGAVLTICTPIALGGFAVAPQLIAAFYSPEFEPAVLALQLLCVASFFIYVHHCYNHILVIFNRQKVVFFVFLLGVLLDLLLNIFLIPRYSLYGAAVAAIVTHFAILVALAVCTGKFTEIRPLHREILEAFSVALIASLVMFFVLESVSLALVFEIFLGVLVYFASVLVLKVLWDRRRHRLAEGG